MKTTMKKRLVKGILAAAFAFVTVLGVPQSANLKTKNDNTIVAYAARCTHKNHVVYDYGPWRPAGTGYERRNGHTVSFLLEIRTVYTKCSKCSQDKSSYEEVRRKYIL